MELFGQLFIFAQNYMFMKKLLKVLGINLGIMIVLVAVILFLLTTWLKSYTRHNESIKVPEVIGLVDEEAISYLEQLGLKPMVIDSLYSDGLPGSVIEQLPEGGLPVKTGRIVYLTINAKSIRMVKMVDVVDFSSRQAKSLLREAGFIVDNVEFEPHEFDDLVLEAKIGGKTVSAGEEYPIKTHVTLVVGSTQVELTPENDETEQGWFE